MHAKEKAGNLLPKEQIAMSSLEIAEISGKLHKNVLGSIRAMESSWEKVTGLKFKPCEYKNKSGRKLPMYDLTKRECLFVASKYNDEIRARIIVRLDELETANIKTLPETSSAYQEETVINIKLGKHTSQIYVKNGVVYTKLSTLMRFLGYSSGGGRQYAEWVGTANTLSVPFGNNFTWFVNANGFDNLLLKTNLQIDGKAISHVYSHIFGVSRKGFEKDAYAYKYTHGEMHNILLALNSSPINKPRVSKLLLDGNMEGGTK